MRAGASREETAAAWVPLDRGAAWLGLLTVVAANCRYLSGLGAVLDPMLAMEPYYIHLAGRPTAEILRQPPAWGPLYALWLKPFVAALGDPLAVYLANLVALSLAVSVLIYLYLLLLTRRAAPAAAAALFFLISDANVPLASKVSGFALLVLLAGWSAALLVPAGTRRLTVAAAAVLAASYARPELYPAALLLWGASLRHAAGERRLTGSAVLAWPGALFAVMLGVGWLLGTPFSGGGRLLDAVREHFAWNWAAWNDRWRYYQAVWNEEFGSAESLLAALRANPGAAAHHLASNVLGVARFFRDDALRHYPLLAPLGSALAVTGETWLVAALLVGALARVIARPPARRLLRARAGDLLVAYAAVGAACISAASVIYPRPHYLVIPSVLLLLAGIQAAALLVAGPAMRSTATRLAAAVVCLALVPRPFVLPSAYAVDGSPFVARLSAARPVTDTLARIRSLNLPPPVRVLTMNDGLGELLGPGFEEVKVWQRGDEPLEAYVREQRVSVVVALLAGRESFVVDDPYWDLLVSRPEAAGFSRVPVPGHDGVGIYVRTPPAGPASGPGAR